MKELSLTSGSAIVIVAHPDDETIWMGGTILSFPNIQWTIFSLCRGDDLDRAPKFKKVCGQYHATPIISDLEDEWIMGIDQSIPEIEKRILSLLPELKYDYIFTHGINGEYGHVRHIGVHKAIAKLILEKKLFFNTTFVFSYKKDGKAKAAQPEKNAEYFIKLDENIYQAKKDLVHSWYGFDKNAFEYLSCSSIETFNTIKKYENSHALRAS